MRRARLALGAMCAVALSGPISAGGVGGPAPGPAFASTPTSVPLFGHGFGHGHGMGQWGAFESAALYHRTVAGILGLYYSNTTTATGFAEPPTIRVWLDGMGSSPIVVGSPGAAFSVDGTPEPAGSWVLFSPDTGAGTWRIETGGSCGTSAGWTAVGSAASPIAAPGSQDPSAPLADLLQLCESGRPVPYRGEIEGVFRSSGAPATLNVLAPEEYLRAVVPSEMPASWGSYGGAGPSSEPWGFQALEAQAIAARSYLLADLGREGFADICASTACQAYTGASAENALSDQAVTDTAGDVQVFSGTLSVAETEYSASTGGYSAGGTFPAVPDPADGACDAAAGIPCNPSHDWTAKLQASTIEASNPTIGAFTGLYVTKRNGLGDLGGRVLEVTVAGTSGSVQLDGSTFAYRYGLPSDWFAVEAASGGTTGYWVVAANGHVGSYGAAAPADLSAFVTAKGPLTAAVATPDGRGMWVVTASGALGVTGDAPYFAEPAGFTGSHRIVGLAASTGGMGLWLVGADGAVFHLGAALALGPPPGALAGRSVVAAAATPDGRGLWLVARDGAVVALGDARPFGLQAVGALSVAGTWAVAAGASGWGLWVAGANGAVVPLGGAPNLALAAGTTLDAGLGALAPSADGGGLDLATTAGQVVALADAPYFGDPVVAGQPLGAAVVALAGIPAAAAAAPPPGTLACAGRDPGWSPGQGVGACLPPTELGPQGSRVGIPFVPGLGWSWTRFVAALTR